MEQVVLDLIPAGTKGVCHVSQNDIGRTIRFNLVSGGTVYTLSGTETIKVFIKKPDGTTAERNIANTSSTYVDWVTGEGDCDVAGKNECELVITAGTTVIGSKNFTMKVEEDPYNGQGVVIETAGPAPIATFTTNIVDLLQSVKCGINAWSDSDVIEKEPYNFRKVAGTAPRIGNHLFDKLVGGTVTWNQMITNGNFASADNWNFSDGYGTMTIANNKATLSLTTNDPNISVTTALNTNVKANHVYLETIDITCSKSIKPRLGYAGDTIPPYVYLTDSVAGQKTKCATIHKLNASSTSMHTGVYFYLNLFNRNLSSGDTVVLENAMIIDLTAMFGSTIANYIYSLEQATAGSGVNFFRKLFPDSYYAYNADELKSVKTTAHKMVGKNLIEQPSYTTNTQSKVVDFGRDVHFDNITVSFTATNAVAGATNAAIVDFRGADGSHNYKTLSVFYNENDVPFLNNNTPYSGRFSTTASNITCSAIYIYYMSASYSAIQSDSLSDFQIEIGSQATAYEPYIEHNYALDDVELRGLFKLDSNNKLYADGDTYESSGDVTRKYKLVDLSTITDWTQSQSTTADGSTCFYTGVIEGLSTETTLTNFISNRFTGSPSQYISGMLNNTAILSSGRIYIAINNNDKSGIFLCPLATPTTETADPFTNPQQVDANGTEEYIDSRTPAIPVGHETYYAQAYSECNVTANGTTHNIPFGELVVESAELDVTNGILKRHDDTTKQLTPLALEAVIGQNSVSCDTGDTEVKYYYNA